MSKDYNSLAGTIPRPANGEPAARPAQRQADGLPQIDPGAKPQRGPLQDRSASPASGNTSGIESSMGALADKEHPRRKR